MASGGVGFEPMDGFAVRTTLSSREGASTNPSIGSTTPRLSQQGSTPKGADSPSHARSGQAVWLAAMVARTFFVAKCSATNDRNGMVPAAMMSKNHLIDHFTRRPRS